VSYCKTQEFAFKKMGVEFQSYVILKRLELEVSAWSRFVEFLKLFKICVVTGGQKKSVFFCLLIHTSLDTPPKKIKIPIFSDCVICLQEHVGY